MNHYLFQLVLHRAVLVCTPPLRPESVDVSVSAPQTRAAPGAGRQPHQLLNRREPAAIRCSLIQRCLSERVRPGAADSSHRGRLGRSGVGQLCRRPPQKAARDCRGVLRSPRV